MKANELPITSFLQAQNVQFVIPVYQRNYDWTNSECKELINDIVSVEINNRGTHFIGSIVFIHEGIYSTSEVKELVIIDGQQRLTTINIIYVALFRFAKENNMPNDSDMVLNMFLTNQYVQRESSKLKLKQTDSNSLAFKTIMYGTENEFNNYSNVIENFNYFRSFITKDNFNIILNGLKRLIFVEVSLERGKDDPQRIFESLNSTGLDLSQSDLIRNYILMDLDPLNQNKVFEQIWNPIEDNARDIVKQKSLVSEYIRDYLTLRNKKIPNKNKVYLEFKKLYVEKDETYTQELENIKSLSVHYKKLINPSSVQDKCIRKELEYISRLEINVAFPFLLQVFEDAENGLITTDELVKILKLIQSYTWRRFVVGLPTNALNKIFMSLYSEVDTEDYYDSIALALIKKRGSGKFPTDEDLKTALKDKDLYNIQSKNRNYMFELLENYNNREYVNTNNESITIEHIFPQTPNKDWNSCISSDDYFMFKEKFLNTLANLTLSGNNGSLSNKTFIEKKAMNIKNGEQGYNYSRLWLNDFLKTVNNWDIVSYNERFNLISKRFLKIWYYPDVVMPIIENTEEQNIFDAEIPTHKKLEYFIFENTKVDEEIISQMYVYVIEKLYEKNPQLLLGASNIFKIARNPEDFRTPQGLDNGYFIESNLDSNSKFNSLKKLLKLFELEDELLIKYTDSSEGNMPNRYALRKEYWKQLLPLIVDTDLFHNVNPTKGHWLSAGAGVTGLGFTFVITGKFARIELVLATSDKDQNKKYFKKILVSKDLIEKNFGAELEWEELTDYKMSRIKYEINNVNLYDKNDWVKMNEFFVHYLPKFQNALQPVITNLK
ncbi:DUF4268 domain-containing protein [Cellulophaga sp. HaHa_2_95]|uniref:DUF4268 domain-containing protein n=1 Tax=Cellulophaga sp. HaHa_2_95 TaxID=2745558 RepID=UPI001C4E3E5B|nr:DUF4268 domain-containing protein [Cellulophaga sp. HaHa_2_95]QXP54846.1 DUF4268 domain-containing protein [Cellulophaga sp. HaHa_2_95]